MDKNHALVEQLDDIITEGCIMSERKCQQRSQQEWTLQVHKIKEAISVWSIFKSWRKRSLPLTNLFSRAQQIGIELSNETTNDEINKRLTELKGELRTIHSQRQSKRDDELLLAANVAEDTKQSNKATTLRKLRDIEHKIRVFKRLDFQQGKDIQSAGISRVEVPISWPTSDQDPDTVEYLKDLKQVKGEENWRMVTCPKEVEYYLKLRNRRHFGQAETEGTPLTATAMKEKFNWEATTYQAELVLKGEYVDDEVDRISAMLLANLKQVLPE